MLVGKCTKWPDLSGREGVNNKSPGDTNSQAEGRCPPNLMAHRALVVTHRLGDNFPAVSHPGRKASSVSCKWCDRRLTRGWWLKKKKKKK